VGIYRQRISGKWWGTGRIEYFLDDQDVLVSGPALLGASLGVDLRLGTRAAWRIEGRLLGSNEAWSPMPDGTFQQTNTAINTALAIRF
jgi:hypothetical protein